MKFSELWLRELVNITLDSEELSEQITMAGLEVSSMKPVTDLSIQGLLVGEITECTPHPCVDKVWVTKVNIGSKHLLDVICDAPNCRIGLKVVIAPIGARLPKNLKIKEKKIYGKLSKGLFCTYASIGISDNNYHIIELPTDAPVGNDIHEYLKLNDNIIEISVTPNRADCLSIIGLAREISVLNNVKVNMPDTTPVRATIDDTLPIRVEAIDACPRYLGRIIKNINIKSHTPLWMKEKLRRSGINSINAIVDITNYILIELGQPMHAFDQDKIDGEIVVRMAQKEETLVLLDGSKAKLNTDILVIADHNKTLALAGIFGGKYSSINKNTQNVLLESAYFNPLFITGRARRYGLQTYASRCYTLGVDPDLQIKAMERATSLILTICGGTAGPIINITSEKALPKSDIITLRRSKLDSLIGCHIDSMQVSNILHRLGFYVSEDQDLWHVRAPSWRFDVKIEEDLIEEIARIYGYDNIPGKAVQGDLVINNNYRKNNLSMNRVKTLLNHKGYQEVITYSFVDPKKQQLIHPSEKALFLLNPISCEMAVMRLSLLTGLLETISYNQSRQQNRVRIFESGLRFVPDTKANLGIRQEMMLAGAICGNRYEEHWDLDKCTVDFYDLKGDLESIFDLTNKLAEIEFCTESIPGLHPGQSSAIYLKDNRVGFIGVIHPKLERKFNLKCRTVLFELEWNKIADYSIPKVQDVSYFPISRRDIAIVVADNIPAAHILAECKKVGMNNKLIDINLFDVYRGKGVAKGFKSLAISLIFQDTNNTLNDKEISFIIIKCVEVLKKKFQASLRD